MQREQLLYRAKAAADRCELLHEADMPLAEKMQAAQKVTTDFVLEDSFLITNVGRSPCRKAAVRMYSITAQSCRVLCSRLRC